MTGTTLIHSLSRVSCPSRRCTRLRPRSSRAPLRLASWLRRERLRHECERSPDHYPRGPQGRGPDAEGLC